jgi:hypothetical protein
MKRTGFNLNSPGSLNDAVNLVEDINGNSKENYIDVKSENVELGKKITLSEKGKIIWKKLFSHAARLMLDLEDQVLVVRETKIDEDYNLRSLQHIFFTSGKKYSNKPVRGVWSVQYGGLKVKTNAGMENWSTDQLKEMQDLNGQLYHVKSKKFRMI